MSENSRTNADVVRVVFDGFNAGDVERVARICADDFILEGDPQARDDAARAGRHAALAADLA